MTENITVRVIVRKPIDVVWFHLLNPSSITQWNQASGDWETTHATIDAIVGGRYLAHMQAKDGFFGFDFVATFKQIHAPHRFTYVLDDQRIVKVTLKKTSQGVEVIQTFDPENENPRSMQQEGWQAILNSFQQFVEQQS
jgi:uncharacterized protein YndB with AHSA1/START domain